MPLTPTPRPACDRLEYCDQRHDDLERRVLILETDSKTHDRSIAALKAQVAAASAFGSIIGGGIVAFVAKVFAG